MASKLCGVNATIVIFVYCILLYCTIQYTTIHYNYKHSCSGINPVEFRVYSKFIIINIILVIEKQ